MFPLLFCDQLVVVVASLMWCFFSQDVSWTRFQLYIVQKQINQACKSVSKWFKAELGFDPATCYIPVWCLSRLLVFWFWEGRKICAIKKCVCGSAVWILVSYFILSRQTPWPIFLVPLFSVQSVWSRPQLTFPSFIVPRRLSSSH